MVHQDDVSFYVKNADLISLRKKHNYKEHEEKSIKTDGRQLLLGALKLDGIGRRDRHYRGIFQHGLD
jgi:hypothetical protein